MSLVQDNDMVQAVTADTPDEPFDIGVLPWTPGSDDHLCDPHIPHPLLKKGAVDTVSVSQTIPWRTVPWEGVDDLLGGPFRRRMLRHGKVYDTPPRVGQHHEHKEHCVGDRWHDKEIQGDEGLCRKFSCGDDVR